MSDWVDAPERGDARLLRLLRRLALTLGRRRTRPLLLPITLYFYARGAPARRALARYYEALGLAPTSRRLFRHHLAFAETILDRVYLWAGRDDAPALRVRGLEALQQERAQGRGCVLLGAHFGSFEAARAAARDEPRLRMQVVMHEGLSQALNDTVAVLHPGVRGQVAPLGSAQDLLRLRETLEEGGLVGLMGDRVVPGEAVYEALFLGRGTAFPLAPLRLAAALRAPVFFFAARYRPAVAGARDYELVCERLAAPAPGGPERAAWLQDLGERYVQTLARQCREIPDNWFNFYDFWHDEAGRPGTPDRGVSGAGGGVGRGLAARRCAARARHRGAPHRAFHGNDSQRKLEAPPPKPRHPVLYTARHLDHA